MRNFDEGNFFTSDFGRALAKGIFFLPTSEPQFCGGLDALLVWLDTKRSFAFVLAMSFSRMVLESEKLIVPTF